MAFLTIQDTGYLKPTNEGTRLGTANRANAGAVIALKNIDFKPSAKANLDTSPVLSASDVAEVNVGTIENLRFTIGGDLDMNLSADRALVYPLTQLAQTKGYKLLFYPDTGTAGQKQLVYQLANSHVLSAGEQTAFSAGAAYAHVHVFIESVNFIHVGIKRDKVNFSITGVITKSETSSI